MSKFNKSYRIRTEVGKDTQVHVNLDGDYDILEIMSLKINQENAYKFHKSNYGVIAGRVLANDVFGIPNAKISVFIQKDEDESTDVIKSVLYPYNTTQTKDKNGVRYNLLTDEQVNECHTIIGTFPEKQYLLDNNSILEVFEKYYKYTTRTNDSGDYMIFGVPVGNQTIHVDVDLSDIGILSQKPRDMFYKGYSIESFENPNKFKYDTNLETLVQVISQETMADVIPFWGEESEGSIGITRCDINVQYKFEPTCVFMGSVVSDTNSNGISKKCIPTPGMGSMEDIVTGSGTIEMIRKTPNGAVEEFSIKGNQLINGDGVWCYQIPMNLDYMMTDEFGNMVPTNHPERGIPTRTRVRFRLSLQEFENDSTNLMLGKVLVPHNPNIYSGSTLCEEELDYSFGTKTKESSYRDLFWNGVYSVKSYIPRIQKGANWKNEKFMGFKRVNYYNDKNPIPYNNIRIKIPFAFTIMCVIIKGMIHITTFLNWLFKLCAASFVTVKDEDGNNKSGSFLSISGELCNDNLDYLCIIPGINVKKIAEKSNKRRKTLLGMALLKHYEELGGDVSFLKSYDDEDRVVVDSTSVDYQNSDNAKTTNSEDKDDNAEAFGSYDEMKADAEDGGKKSDRKYNITLTGIRVTDSVDYLISCIEMNLAKEYKVIQFDFYNDWINGLIYMPRWMRNITKKHSYLWGFIKFGGEVKACTENKSRRNINLVQQCGLAYSSNSGEFMQVTNPVGCKKTKKKKTREKLRCHKASSVRKKYGIFTNGGLVHSEKTIKDQYVYYFKPVDMGSSQIVRLLSTDIILLGTLNNCDKLGITGDLTELVASTYQMPPNLALTDSDLEGNDFESKLGDGKKIEMTLIGSKARVNELKLGGCYVGINPTEEDANYTEIAGISWTYTGPLQDENVPTAESTNMFNPGGHFLGITCRNSSTTIKTCVNLTRICEHGIWMSQRQELNIPNPTTPTSAANAFLPYATVPSGVISKDEISDTNYRRLFASLNKNRLRTKINPETGYPVYDFEYVNPTNFNGELRGRIYKDTTDASYFNRYIKEVNTEHYSEFIDDDYYLVGEKTVVSIDPEKQIMRTGEFSDSEYMKFRFGLTDADFDSNGNVKASARNSRFLIKDSGTVSFPMFDNSFYFYFGLKHGSTALDEFKKTYYANCGSVDLVTQSNNISLIGVEVEYDGLENDSDGNGSISFKKINVNPEILKQGVTITLLDDKNNQIDIIETTESTEGKFENLVAGNYKIKVSADNGNMVKEISVSVKRISFYLSIVSHDFKKVVSTKADDYTANFNDYDDRIETGGYLTIPSNTISYKKSDFVTEEVNIFASPSIAYYKIISDDSSIVINGEGNKVTFNGVTKTLVKDESTDEYIIPVPKPNANYNVRVYGYLNSNNKLLEDSEFSNTVALLNPTTTPVTISNGLEYDFFYNDVSYKNELSQYIDSDQICDSTSTNGWWNYSTDDSGRYMWDTSSDNLTRWKIKSTLYIDHVEDSSKLHSIPITIVGGNPIYATTLTGMYEDLSSSFTDKDNLSKLDAITVPTLNYRKNGKRRSNFGFQVVDAINQKLPENNQFIMPIIYKPFFFESLLMNYDGYGVYLCGNIYNGKTWTESEGFNNVIFNSQKLSAITTTIPDTNMSINEYDDTDTLKTGGGIDYTGDLCKYNGRKIPFLRAFSSFDVYSLNNNGEFMNCDLSIGSYHVHDNGAVYEDSTSIKSNNMALYSFVMDTKLTNGILEFKMDIPPTVGATSYKLFALINGDNDVTNGCYKYPFSQGTNKPNITDTLLFRKIINGTLTSPFTKNGHTKNQFIPSNHDLLSGGKGVYYVAIPDYPTDADTTSNENNVFKSVSVSKLINVEELQKYYPLELVAENDKCADILNADGTFKTTLTIICDDEQSRANIANKRITLYFYDNEKMDNLLYSIVINPNADKKIVWEPTSSEREKIGIKNTMDSTNETTILYFNYKAEIPSENSESPSMYGIRKMFVKFINNKPTM
jgi:hypothetical protein